MDYSYSPAFEPSFLDSKCPVRPLTVGVTTDPMRYMCRSASRARKPSRYKQMVARAMWWLRCVEQYIGFFKFMRTLAIFLSAALFLAPCLAVIHALVRIGRTLWIRLLRWNFPDIHFEEDPCIRSAMDTYRTQGVVALLLQIKGKCDPQEIAKNIEKEVVMKVVDDKRCGKRGNQRLAHPQLSMLLTTRWGRYAWEKPKRFNIDRHVVLGSSLFRGRPVTEFNVQEYVSDIVSKYLPPDIPPWQATIIPVFSQEERYFILFRLHHLACKGLVLEHLQEAMTPAKGFSPPDSPTTTIPASMLQAPPDAPDQTPPPPPSISPPSPDKLCSPPAPKAVRSFASHVLQRVSRAWCEITSSSSISQALYSMAGITLGLASVLFSFARREGITYKLTRDAIAEAVFLTGVAFEGPRILLRELLPEKLNPHDTYFRPTNPGARRQSGHHLQTVSLCGRKAVAWSDPVSLDTINKICAAIGSTHTEVLLTAASGSLRNFFRQSGLPTPTVVTAALPLPLSAKRDEGGGGFALISLPTREEDPEMALEDMKRQIRAQEERKGSLLLSAWLTKNAARILPSFGIRLLLNALTKKYSVTVSNIPAGPPGSDGFRLWEQEVESFIIWRPQQANTSVSLSLMTYKGTVRLGVMADQQLAPQHSAIASAFPRQISEIAVFAGVPRDRLSSTSNRPSSGSPWISPLASPRPSPMPSPRPSPKTSPQPSPPVLRKTRNLFLQLPGYEGQNRRRRVDSEGSSGGGGDESDNSLSSESSSLRQRKQDEERAAAIASAVANKFRGAGDSN